ncbi:MAG: hypothetical protein KF745_02715 [Phycisphaeraceae bacterium]|nr:hypothetical protein [Phycisphaeraceae bacterium]
MDDSTLQGLIERQEQILDRNIEAIASVDSKVNFAATIDTALLGVIAAVVPEPSAVTWDQILAALCGSAGCVVSLFFCWVATFPQTEGPGSLIYFGKICKRNASEYREAVLACGPAEYLNDLIAQTHVNAEIAAGKHGAMKYALGYLFSGVILWAAAVAYLYRG